MQQRLKTLALSCSFSFLMTPAMAQDDGPKSFRINSIRSHGSGCPAGTVAVNVSDDQEAFTLSFSAFYAELSPSTGPEQRKSCRVIFDTEQDVGWEYAIFAVMYRGFAALDAGVQGQQNLRFGARGKEAESSMQLAGPYEADYVNSQELPLNRLKWSGCQSNKQKDFAIQAELWLRATDPAATGLFTVDTIDGEIRQDYEVLWRECKGGPKTVAICRLTVQDSNNGSYQLISKGHGKHSNKALAKAQAKMAKKCQKLQGRAPACNASQAVCNSVNL